MNSPTIYRDIIVDFINWSQGNETISFSAKELNEIANYLEKLDSIKSIVEEYNSDKDRNLSSKDKRNIKTVNK